MTTTYAGVRTDPRTHTVTVTTVLGPDVTCGGLLHHVKHHSDAFSWGYGGSGPADLARSIVIDVTGSIPVADRYYQAFKRSHVVHWGDHWSITDDEVCTWLEAARILERAGIVG